MLRVFVYFIVCCGSELNLFMWKVLFRQWTDFSTSQPLTRHHYFTSSWHSSAMASVESIMRSHQVDEDDPLAADPIELRTRSVFSYCQIGFSYYNRYWHCAERAVSLSPAITRIYNDRRWTSDCLPIKVKTSLTLDITANWFRVTSILQ